MENLSSIKREFIVFLESMPEGLTENEIDKRISDYIKMKSDVKTNNKKTVWKSSVGRFVFVCSVLLSIITILIMTDFFHLDKQTKFSYFDLIAYCAWTVLPPAWFLYEYVWLFSDENKLDANQLSDLKYTHELASKIWAGVVLLITAVLYIKYGTGNLFPHTP